MAATTSAVAQSPPRHSARNASRVVCGGGRSARAGKAARAVIVSVHLRIYLRLAAVI